MRRRKSPQRSKGAQKPPGRVRVRGAGRNLEEAEMESSQLPGNSCTSSLVAQAGPASCTCTAANAEESNILSPLRESLVVVSVKKPYGTNITYVKETTIKKSVLCMLLFLILLSALIGACCGVSLARIQWTKEFLQMLSLQTAPRPMNSGNLLTEETQGIENQRNGVSYLAEERGIAMKDAQDLREAVCVIPKEKCFTKYDQALKSAGVSIDLQRSSRSAWHCKVAWFLCTQNVVDTFEQLDMSPGYCWRLKESQSQVVFNLPTKVQPTAVTVQHSVETNLWHVSSAPRDFAVFGLDEEGEKEALLGKFTYDVRKEVTQTFQLQVQSLRMGRRPFQKHCFGSKSVAGGVLGSPCQGRGPARAQRDTLRFRGPRARDMAG
ncbi:sperm-associated antigen 4 protein isoform X3 [Gallus gallus]|uniref:sperm-associated antigen 4 protein isoform X3 n=1 Tax=Gallus gallus TaxID=9031 RepID=UPI001AEB2BEB|nr:sperm-associated antigen 4 protein isoform X3 [Gallus gallus]XP_046792634.1 sperm-associated antigen 4 protein isoform X3 [Gallus gallus]